MLVTAGDLQHFAVHAPGAFDGVAVVGQGAFEEQGGAGAFGVHDDFAPFGPFVEGDAAGLVEEAVDGHDPAELEKVAFESAFDLAGLGEAGAGVVLHGAGEGAQPAGFEFESEAHEVTGDAGGLLVAGGLFEKIFALPCSVDAHDRPPQRGGEVYWKMRARGE